MRRDEVGALIVELPETRRERVRGLRGRAALGPDRAMLFRRCRSVHTFGVRFPIDVVLLDRGWRVVAVVRLRPRRVLAPRLGVRHVLEVAAGSAPPAGSRLAFGRHHGR